MCPRFLCPFLLLFWFAQQTSAAIVTGAFGVNGEGGTTNGQLFNFGTGGSVFELNTFIRIGGQDLNGAQIGTAAQRLLDSRPAEVGVVQIGLTQSISA